MSDDHGELPVAVRARRLEDQVIAAGLTTDAELDEILAGRYRTGSPANGARIRSRDAPTLGQFFGCQLSGQRVGEGC